MNSHELFKLTKSELEIYLNSTVCNVNETSEYPEHVKMAMIEEMKKLFDDSINVSIGTVTYSEVSIGFKNFSITVKVSVKKTGKTVKVSRLRKRDVVKPNKFKVDDISVFLDIPFFEKSDIGRYNVILSSFSRTNVLLNKRTEKFEDMLSPDILMTELSSQDEEWNDIRNRIILSAAQPIIKKEYFQPNFGQEDWDRILLETERENSKLIDDVIKNMFNITI